MRNRTPYKYIQSGPSYLVTQQHFSFDPTMFTWISFTCRASQPEHTSAWRLFTAHKQRLSKVSNFADTTIQMEWWHSENEGSLQTFEDTIYEFALLQKTGLLSAQKGNFSPLKWKKHESIQYNHKLVRFQLRLVQEVSEAYHKKEQEPHRNVWSTTSYQHAQIYDLQNANVILIINQIHWLLSAQSTKTT